MATKTIPELDEFVTLSKVKLDLTYDANDLKTLRKKAVQDLRVNVARLRRMRDYNAPDYSRV